jgi:uncharacterized membrane protein YdjX (TVP38/TMEM64 family)
VIGRTVRALPRTVRLRLALLLVILTAGGSYAITVGLPSEERVQAVVTGWGAAGVLVFILGYSALTLTPVPVSAATVLAGVLFGVPGGVAIVLAAGTLGAYGGFWMGRLLGREAVERLIGSRVARVNEVLRRRGLLAVLGIRLVPVVPFAVVNYTAGLTAVRQTDYVLGTAIGIAPATLAYVVLGAYGSSPLSWPFVIAVAALILLTVGAWLVLRRARASAAPPAVD